jgi:serine/threonine protein kinase
LTNYLAPELTELGADFSESTDVWSLGCILFDLTTASFLDEAEAVARLGEVREDPYKLEEVFEDVAKVGVIHCI